MKSPGDGQNSALGFYAHNRNGNPQRGTIPTSELPGLSQTGNGNNNPPQSDRAPSIFFEKKFPEGAHMKPPRRCRSFHLRKKVQTEKAGTKPRFKDGRLGALLWCTHLVECLDIQLMIFQFIIGRWDFEMLITLIFWKLQLVTSKIFKANNTTSNLQQVRTIMGIRKLPMNGSREIGISLWSFFLNIPGDQPEMT